MSLSFRSTTGRTTFPTLSFRGVHIEPQRQKGAARVRVCVCALSLRAIVAALCDLRAFGVRKAACAGGVGGVVKGERRRGGVGGETKRKNKVKYEEASVNRKKH